MASYATLSSSSPHSLLAPLLSDPDDRRLYYVLPRKPTGEEQKGLHKAALDELDSRWPLRSNTSRVVDFAYLGQFESDQGSAPAVLAYYDSGEVFEHGRGCTESSCIGHTTLEEATKHDLVVAADTSQEGEYMCRDDETWNRYVKRRWENEHSDPNLPFRPIIVSDHDSIKEWNQSEYGMEPTHETYTNGLNTKRRSFAGRPDHAPKNQTTAQIQVSSSRHGRSRQSQKYYDEVRPSTTADMSVSEQQVALGLILVKQEKDTRKTEIHTRLGVRFHDRSEVNTLCRGWSTKGECVSNASIPLTGDDVKILNDRCHPGDGYNVEPGLISALEAHYVEEVKPKLILPQNKYLPWSAILNFEESEAGRIASRFPGLTSLLKSRLCGPSSSAKQVAALLAPEEEHSDRSYTRSTNEARPGQPSMIHESSDDDADTIVFSPPKREDTMSTAITRQSGGSTTSLARSDRTVLTEPDDTTPRPETTGDEGEAAFHRRKLLEGMKARFGEDYKLPRMSGPPSETDE